MSIDTASNLDGHVSNDLIPQLNSTNYKKYKKITYFFCFVFNFFQLQLQLHSILFCISFVLVSGYSIVVRQSYTFLNLIFIIIFLHYLLVPLYPPPPSSHHTEVHVHECFFLFAQFLHPLASPLH